MPPVKTCTSCGAGLDAASVFCTACGAVVTPTERTAPGEPVADAFSAIAAPSPATTIDASSARVDPSAPVEPAGKLIDGKYEIVRVLGEGGMGVVYLAKDVHTQGSVVLKAIRPELAHRADIRERTLAEGRALAQIDHINVVHLNAVVADRSSLWLVMQYIDGESLDKTLKRLRAEGKQMPFPTAVSLFKQIVMGVGAAHAEGVIHRDIKPANVLVRKKDGVAKVTDFGIAKPEEKAREGKGNTKGIIGSLWYMSPEQVSGRKDIDKRVDIYGLGVLFYELLTCHVPFDAASSYELMRKHVEDPFPLVRAERPDIPSWVDEMLQKMCAKDRNARYGSCEEVLAALEPHVVAPTAHATRVAPLPPQASLATHPGTARTTPGESGGGWKWVVAVVAILAIGATGATLYVTQIAERPASHRRPQLGSAAPASEASSSASGETASAAPSASASAPPVDPAELLEGSWASETGRQFDAVHVGRSVEFRVHDAKEFEPADYRTGEARFTLTPVESEPTAYDVEDKIRPNPPTGSTFDSDRSRNSCQEVWTSVGGRPLRAAFDGERLTVDFAKIAPPRQTSIRTRRRSSPARACAKSPPAAAPPSSPGADPAVASWPGTARHDRRLSAARTHGRRVTTARNVEFDRLAWIASAPLAQIVPWSIELHRVGALDHLSSGDEVTSWRAAGGHQAHVALHSLATGQRLFEDRRIDVVEPGERHQLARERSPVEHELQRLRGVLLFHERTEGGDHRRRRARCAYRPASEVTGVGERTQCLLTLGR